MFDLALKGRIVTPGGILDDGWVAIAGERIAAIGVGVPPQARDLVDYGTAYVLPGVIDGQTHAGSHFGFSGLEQTTLSAIAGGITTIVDMPYDQPDPVTTANLLNEKAQSAERVAYCDVALYATIPNTPNGKDIDELIQAGACAFKISSFENHPTRFPRIDNGAAMALLEHLAETDIPIGLHNEDQDLVRALTRQFIAEGKTTPHYHDLSRPESAELLATANFLELGALTGAHVHIVHISTPDGFAMVERFAERGVRATAEMCVHYLHFDAAADMDRLGGLMKVNPPIRPHRREALWTCLESGACSFVSSDHSAWPIERKKAESIFEVAAGVPGLETLLPALFSDIAARSDSDAAAEGCARLLGEGPARFFGLERKGTIAPGMDADFVVLNPVTWRFDASKTQDGLNWSPYDGEDFTGRIDTTYVRGRKVWEKGTLVGTPGHGQFVPRG